jgi:hypothetical protein
LFTTVFKFASEVAAKSVAVTVPVDGTNDSLVELTVAPERVPLVAVVSSG